MPELVLNLDQRNPRVDIPNYVLLYVKNQKHTNPKLSQRITKWPPISALPATPVCNVPLPLLPSSGFGHVTWLMGQ